MRNHLERVGIEMFVQVIRDKVTWCMRQPVF